WKQRRCTSQFPSEPSPPPESPGTKTVRKNSVICKWDPPLDDGGSEILNYTLEKKDNSKLEFGWSSVTSTLRGCRYLVPKLIEKKEYIFRVVAENKFGAGPPCISKPLIAKNPFGMTSFILRPGHGSSEALT
uniref:Fibronectin type-III domain-containing protein n=1 Tax=Seriola dumerili TaxID=41447 RepID=A0A3B4TC27_SERDU